jgi:hypothetical protein
VSASTVVLAIGMQSLMSEQKPDLPDQAIWYRVGDCRNPGNAMQAIHQAFDLAIRI